MAAAFFLLLEPDRLREPAFFATPIGVLEVALAFALIFGFLHAIAYPGGFLLSLVLWSVPEGFGGPYGPGSTDLGTGVIYGFGFPFLFILNAAFGSSRWSLDALIELRGSAWRRTAELQGEPSTRSSARPTQSL